jgi:hypothetical protein
MQTFQEAAVFFNFNGEYPHLPSPPSRQSIKDFLASKERPLNEVIVSPDNAGPFDSLVTSAFTVLRRPNHSPRGQRFGIYGRSGGGKTYLMGQYAKTLDIPYVLVQSEALDNTWTLFELICKEFERWSQERPEMFSPIVPHEAEDRYVIPPCIVAFDEAHMLPPKLMKGGLLCAMEHNDGMLQTKPKGRRASPITVDCRNIGWAVMTTDKGKLFDALKSRCDTTIEWATPGPEEITKIVQMQLAKEYDHGELTLLIPKAAAQIVAKYETVPRAAIAFGRRMVQQMDRDQTSWESVAEKVAINQRKTDSGFDEKQILVLKALGQRPISKHSLTVVAQCRRLEELENDILPGLQDYSNGGPYVVSLSGRGCTITRAGLRKLTEMGIPHKGDKVSAENLENQ